eukprot:scaffold1328_cov394-Prasinococcus_capsulatus_cf.AAC.32
MNTDPCGGFRAFSLPPCSLDRADGHDRPRRPCGHRHRLMKLRACRGFVIARDRRSAGAQRVRLPLAGVGRLGQWHLVKPRGHGWARAKWRPASGAGHPPPSME